MMLGAVLTSSVLISGCHQAKTPVATDADVAATQEQAIKEVQDARTEARKDLKNAAKQAGPDSKNAEIARVTGSFDVAMASADGDHKVALEKCLTLPPNAQQACKDDADAQYQAAAASAKSARVSKLSGG
jgi:outer membrane murein-binding lipoprotein Lpp